MTTTGLIETIKKHGALGVLCAWLVWMNVRLNNVEEKLFICYDKITADQTIENLKNQFPKFWHSVAVLPEDKKRK